MGGNALCKNGCGRRAPRGFPTCCRTCERTGGREHGQKCTSKARGTADSSPPPPPEPAAAAAAAPAERSSFTPVPRDEGANLCINGCGRKASVGHATCCRTCGTSGGTKHGPKCDMETRAFAGGGLEVCVRAVEAPSVEGACSPGGAAGAPSREPPFLSSPLPPPPAAAAAGHHPLELPGDLGELLRSGAVQLVKRAWLMRSFIGEGRPIVRRQELPRDAIVPPGDAARALEGRPGCIIAISHAWLDPTHPDPKGDRRQDLKECLWRYSAAKYMFWDFLSLPQLPLAPEDIHLSRVAAHSMHLLYGHPHVRVLRLMRIPPGARLSTPYSARAWCSFESLLACLGAFALESLPAALDEPSPVPLPPDAFAADLRAARQQLSLPTDRDLLAAQYERVWSERASSLEAFQASGWRPGEVDQFLRVIDSLPRLKKLSLYDCKAPTRELQAQLSARGISLHEPAR